MDTPEAIEQWIAERKKRFPTAENVKEKQQKLDEAIVLRKVVTDANKVFEVEILSSDTFLVPSMHATQQNSSWNDESVFTGKVTCSVPFCMFLMFIVISSLG